MAQQYAVEQGIITHQDDRCKAGSVIIALTVSYVLTHEIIKPKELLNYLIPKIEPISQLFAEELKNLITWLQLPFEQAINRIAKSGKPEFQDYFWDKISPYVIPTVLVSLYAFLTNIESYTGSISTAIEVGGDVDTTAAITGAISGAYLVVDAIPLVYKKEINDKGEWGYAELMKLAEKLTNSILQDE